MVSDTLFSSATVEWATPQDLFDSLDKVYHFTLDVCSTHENAKCEQHYTIEEDGLKQPWIGSCWMNPPYGREIGVWIKKAYETGLQGHSVVCLIPARTDTKWWHEYVMQAHTVMFIKGRLKFGGSKNPAPFPSALVVFDGNDNTEFHSLLVNP